MFSEEENENSTIADLFSLISDFNLSKGNYSKLIASKIFPFIRIILPAFNLRVLLITCLNYV